MIIKFGVAVVGARGTAGGLIFSRNGAVDYARAWSRSANQKSALQTTQRSTLTKFAAAWRDLSQAQRDDWDDYADDPAQELTNSLGVDYFVSGFNWYVRINTHLTAAGEAARDDAPTLTRPVAPLPISLRLWVTGAVSDSRVIFDTGDPQFTLNHVIFIAVLSSQGRNVAPSKLPFTTLTVPTLPLGIVLLQDELEERFGVIAEGQRAFASSQAQDAHGQRGPEAVDFDDARS